MSPERKNRSASQGLTGPPGEGKRKRKPKRNLTERKPARVTGARRSKGASPSKSDSKQKPARAEAERSRIKTGCKKEQNRKAA